MTKSGHSRQSGNSGRLGQSGKTGNRTVRTVRMLEKIWTVRKNWTVRTVETVRTFGKIRTVRKNWTLRTVRTIRTVRNRTVGSSGSSGQSAIASRKEFLLHGSLVLDLFLFHLALPLMLT